MILVDALHSLMLAQAEGGGQGSQSGPYDGLIQIGGPILMFVVIYLLLIRPAGKQRREHASMLNNLKAEDEIITTGGMIGKITRIEDKIVTLEVADKVKVRILRDRIAGRLGVSVVSSGQK